MLRYVERNLLRAGLVEQAEMWQWSSLHRWGRTVPVLELQSPLARTSTWLTWVNEPQSADEESALRLSIKRSRPYGTQPWTEEIATTLDLEASLRSPGRQGERSET